MFTPAFNFNNNEDVDDEPQLNTKKADGDDVERPKLDNAQMELKSEIEVKILISYSASVEEKEKKKLL